MKYPKHGLFNQYQSNGVLSCLCLRPLLLDITPTSTMLLCLDCDIWWLRYHREGMARAWYNLAVFGMRWLRSDALFLDTGNLLRLGHCVMRLRRDI